MIKRKHYNRISSIGTKSLNHTITLCQIKAYCMKVFLQPVVHNKIPQKNLSYLLDMSYVQSLFYLFLLHLHIIPVIFHLSTLLICPRVWHGLLHLLDLCGNVYHLSVVCWCGILDVFIQLRFLLCWFILFFILVYNFCIYSILKIPWIFVKYFVFVFYILNRWIIF